MSCGIDRCFDPPGVGVDVGLDVIGQPTAGLEYLMEKYADLPMDLADAALVHVADRDGLRTVFTLDRHDFGVHRLPGGKPLTLLPKAAG